MKQQINPAVAAVIVVVLILVAGFYVWRGGVVAHDADAKPPGMPADVAAEFNRRMGGVTGPDRGGSPNASGAASDAGRATAPTAPGN